MVIKRSYNEMNQNAGQDGENTVRQSPYMPMFEQFRTELDEHHDRRERSIKASRDVTASSKKIIFTLQRMRTLGEPLPQHVIKANKQYYDTIKSQLTIIAKEAQGINFYRYNRQISPGCQEYLEAVLFEHYLTTASLMDYPLAIENVRQMSSANVDGETLHLDLTWEDYLLGLFDMTGELMRFAITAMATKGALPAVSVVEGDRNVLHDMRALRTALEALEFGHGPFAKDVSRKMQVMKDSVEKIEKTLYGLTVRGAERPKGWMPDLQTIDVES